MGALKGAVESVREEVWAWDRGDAVSGCFQVSRSPGSAPFEVVGRRATRWLVVFDVSLIMLRGKQ